VVDVHVAAVAVAVAVAAVFWGGEKMECSTEARAAAALMRPAGEAAEASSSNRWKVMALATTTSTY